MRRHLKFETTRVPSYESWTTLWRAENEIVPRSGIASETWGKVSVTILWKTVSERRMVTPESDYAVPTFVWYNLGRRLVKKQISFAQFESWNRKTGLENRKWQQVVMTVDMSGFSVRFNQTMQFC